MLTLTVPEHLTYKFGKNYNQQLWCFFEGESPPFELCHGFQFFVVVSNQRFSQLQNKLQRFHYGKVLVTKLLRRKKTLREGNSDQVA